MVGLNWQETRGAGGLGPAEVEFPVLSSCKTLGISTAAGKASPAHMLRWRRLPPPVFVLAFVFLAALPECRAANSPGTTPASTNAPAVQSSPAVSPRVGAPTQTKLPAAAASSHSLPDTPENRLAGYRSLKWDVQKQGGFVMSMCMGVHGELWIGCESSGVWRYRPLAPDGHRWVHFTTKTDSGLGDDNAYALACDRLGRVWVGTLNHGVSVYNGQRWRNYGVVDGPIGSRVFAISTCPKDGDVWIATEAGLSRYSLKNDIWSSVTRSNGLPSDQANAITFDESGNIFVGTQCDGIAMAEARGGYKTWRVVTGPERAPNGVDGNGLPTGLINSVAVSERAVWVGTTTGLARSGDHGATWQFVRGSDWRDKVLNGALAMTPAAPDPLAHTLLEDYVTSVCAQDGLIYVGHWRKGWEVLDEATGVRVSGVGEAKAGGDYITSVLALEEAMVLLASYGSGLCSWAPPSPAGAPRTFAAAAGVRPGAATDTAANTAPPLPASAPAPSQGEITELLAAVRASLARRPALEAEPAFLGEDWDTQGDWIRCYWRYAILWAGHSPLDDYIVSDASYMVRAQLGPHHRRGDGLRHWLHRLTSKDQRVLWNPAEGTRRQSEIDDHGEDYKYEYEGPDLWLTVTVPSGTHRVSLYFFNKDGHLDSNRWRDYLVELKPYSTLMQDADTLSALAHTRVRHFWGGCYKSFVLPGPNRYYVKIARNGSLNTILPAVFLDRLPDEPGSSRTGLSPYLRITRPAPPSIRQNGTAPAPAPMGAGADAALVMTVDLWSSLDQGCRAPELLPVQWVYRLMCYRAAVSRVVSSAVSRKWGRTLHQWTADDRQRFDRQALEAWKSVRWLKPK